MARDTARQLPLPLDVRPALRREDFIVAPSNQAAVSFLDHWPDWPVRAAALCGPKGCGKTHLVAVWRAASDARTLNARALDPEWVAQLAPGVPVAIEDIDAFPLGEDREHALLALFERPAGALLLTGEAPPSRWLARIGDLASRFASLLEVPIASPDDALLANLARKLFADRQLQVAASVIQRMLVALERTPAAVCDMVAEADAKALAERRPVTERLVQEILDAKERKLL